MSLERIIAALIIVMQEVPGLGHLYAYERLFVPPEDVQSIFGIDDVATTRGWSIRSWHWSEHGVTEERQVLDGTVVNVTHHLAVHGYMEHNDAWQSEVQFRQRLEAVRAKLRAPDAIAPDAVITKPPQMVSQGSRLPLVVLGDTYLCHDAIITLDAQEVLYQDAEGYWLSRIDLDDTTDC